MDPHFLCNVLNTVAALAMVAPSKVIQAVGCLRQFLRASFAQEERALVPLEEELALVRFGEQLSVDETIDPGLLQALITRIPIQTKCGILTESGGISTTPSLIRRQHRNQKQPCHGGRCG